MKKSFKDNNPAARIITQQAQEPHNAHETEEAHDVQEKQQVQLTQGVHGTQGRKGHKLPRINMAFTAENLEYLQLIGRIEGISATAYVNKLLKADSETRAEEVIKAKGILKGAD